MSYEQDLARTKELAEQTQAELGALIAAFPTASGAQAVLKVKPRPGDWARVFVPAVAESMRLAYAPIWERTPQLGIAPDKTQMNANFAMSQMFGYPNTLITQFPGGYARIAPHMVPDRLWVCWRYKAPGAASGHNFDGLVWVDDHFAWFPKPWRVLGSAAPAGVPEN
jgi:hypothetical protein